MIAASFNVIEALRCRYTESTTPRCSNCSFWGNQRYEHTYVSSINCFKTGLLHTALPGIAIILRFFMRAESSEFKFSALTQRPFPPLLRRTDRKKATANAARKNRGDDKYKASFNQGRC